MPSSGSTFPALLVSFILLTVLAWEALVRRTPSDARDVRDKQDEVTLHPTPATHASTFLALLCAFLCGVGVIWLFPWATILPSREISGLFPGVTFLALLSIGTFYALKSVEIDKK